MLQPPAWYGDSGPGSMSQGVGPGPDVCLEAWRYGENYIMKKTFLCPRCKQALCIQDYVDDVVVRKGVRLNLDDHDMSVVEVVVPDHIKPDTDARCAASRKIHTITLNMKERDVVDGIRSSEDYEANRNPTVLRAFIV